MGRAVAQDRNSMALPPATGRLADANYRITADFVGRPNVFILYFTHALTVQSLRSDLPCSGLLYAPSGLRFPALLLNAWKSACMLNPPLRR
jgi:hypothetical protein